MYITRAEQRTGLSTHGRERAGRLILATGDEGTVWIE